MESSSGFSDVFSVSRQGAGGNLAWANVNIGGTLDNPSEDLSARLIKAAGNRLTEIGMGKAAEVADVAARLLNREPRKTERGMVRNIMAASSGFPPRTKFPPRLCHSCRTLRKRGLKQGMT